ncbi:hypothetical protein DEDE109153_15390 [Deinococcus deserti]
MNFRKGLPLLPTSGPSPLLHLSGLSNRDTVDYGAMMLGVSLTRLHTRLLPALRFAFWRVPPYTRGCWRSWLALQHLHFPRSCRWPGRRPSALDMP